jgi:hypothetical protein
MATKKDRTEVGITGKLVPKPTTAKQQHELEKKRRMQKHLGKNVGGVQYSSDVTPYYNPLARTFREFVEIAEAHKLTHKFPLSSDERETAIRIGRIADSDSKPEKPKRSTPTTRSARKITKFDLSSIVKEGEEQINEMPYQIYGPDPHGPSDAEPQPLGKPYKNKKRARTRVDKLDQEIGAYRHFVRKVDEESELGEKFVPISNDKARRMRNRSFNIGQQSFNTRHTDPEKSKTLQGKKSLIDTIHRDMYSRRLKTVQSTGKPNPEYDNLTYKQQVAHVKGKEKANKQKGKR